jgi:NarL family two-component system response regulator LiaR
MTAKILIVEDHDDFREIVKTYLQNRRLDVEILEAVTGEAGVEKALREKPDIVLMDIRLPNMNGIDAASQIKKHLPGCEIIVLTMFETETFKKVFKTEDVSAYIGKSEIYEKLVPAIKKILSRGSNLKNSKVEKNHKGTEGGGK